MSKNGEKNSKLLDLLFDNPTLPGEWVKFSDFVKSHPQDKRWNMQIFLEILNSWVSKNPTATIEDLCQVLRRMSYTVVAEKLQSSFAKDDLVSSLLDKGTELEQAGVSFISKSNMQSDTSTNCSQSNIPTKLAHDEQLPENKLLKSAAEIKWPITHGILKPVKNFTGREEILKTLHAHFESKDEDLVLICGFGGVGKTDLCRKFAFDLSNFAESGISRIWLQANTPQVLRDSISKLAMAMGFTSKADPSPSEYFEYLATSILEKSSRLLVIIDNVDTKYEDVIKLIELVRVIKTEGMFVIVTSRDSSVLDGAGTTIKLNVLDRDEAKIMLQKSIADLTDPDAFLMCDLFQYFPLALQQSVSYIKEQQRNFQTLDYAVSDYVKEFERKKRSMLSQKLKRIESDYSMTTLVVWDATLANMSKTAIAIVHVLAFLEPSQISISFLEEICKKVNVEGNIFDGLNILLNYSLIKRDKRNISVYPLVQEVIRLKINDPEYSKKLFDNMFLTAHANRSFCWRQKEHFGTVGKFAFQANCTISLNDDFGVILRFLLKFDRIDCAVEFAKLNHKTVQFSSSLDKKGKIELLEKLLSSNDQSSLNCDAEKGKNNPAQNKPNGKKERTVNLENPQTVREQFKRPGESSPISSNTPSGEIDERVQEAMQNIKDSYDRTMKDFLALNPTSLTDAHRLQTEECCKQLQLFLSDIDLGEPKKRDYVRQMEMSLTLKLNKIKREQQGQLLNQLEIEKLNMRISKAISDCRKEYNDKMEAAFPRNAASFDPLTLKKLHDRNLSDVCKLLEFILQKLGESIPIEKNVETLQKQVLLDWEEVCKSNTKKIKKEEEAQQDKEKQNKKMEAEEILRQNNIKTDKQKTRAEHITSATSQVDAWRINVSSSSTSSQRKPSTLTTQEATPRTDFDANCELPPIAIEFGLENTRVGYMNGDSLNLISNPWGTHVTSNKLGITNDDEVIIGEEVTNRQNVRMTYYLDKVLFDENDGFYHWISTDLDKKVKKAFLIGLFLSKIKSDVEELFQGRWTTVIITVPLWYTSVQRQNTKDAAQIAGFSKVCLINETSAAALAIVSNPVRQQQSNGNHILVTVANDNHFDAAVYEYRYGEVKIVSSWGDRHCSQQYMFSFKRLARRVVNSLPSLKVTPQVDIRQLFRDGVGQNKYITATIFIDVGRYYNLTNSLRNITEHFGRPYYTNRMPSSDFIMFGAAKYAESTRSNDFTKAKLVKDIATYSFQRKVERGPPKLIFDSYQPLEKTEIPCEHTVSLQSSELTRLEIQETSGDNDFPVGTLILHRPQQPVQEIQARFLLNNEGIFRAQAYYFNDRQTKITINAEWISSNLSDTEKAEYASLVDLLKKDKKKLVLKKSKLELQSLSNEIESKIQGVSSAIGKSLLQKEVAEAKAIFDNSQSTQENIDVKITTLRKLKAMYMK